MTQQTERGLRQNFLFAPLGESELNDFAARVKLQEIGAGERVVTEGELADALYVVLEGGVNVTKANGQFLAYLGPGGFFGEMALFMEGSARSASCIAATKTVCIVVHKTTLDTFCSENPASGLKIYRVIIRTLAERLQATSADLAILMSSQVRSQDDVSNMVEAARRRLKR